jgi:hypothetical protein
MDPNNVFGSQCCNQEAGGTGVSMPASQGNLSSKAQKFKFSPVSSFLVLSLLVFGYSLSFRVSEEYL